MYIKMSLQSHGLGRRKPCSKRTSMYGHEQGASQVSRIHVFDVSRFPESQWYLFSNQTTPFADTVSSITRTRLCCAPCINLAPLSPIIHVYACLFTFLVNSVNWVVGPFMTVTSRMVYYISLIWEVDTRVLENHQDGWHLSKIYA